MSLNSVQKKLRQNSFRLYNLSPEEIPSYIEYRFSSLIRSKYVLTTREMEYLLCETGRGSLRFDPEIVRCINTKEYYEAIPIEDTKNKKLEIATLVRNDITRTELKDLYTKAISQYFQGMKVVSYSPFIIDCEFQRLPTRLLIFDGAWCMPDNQLFQLLHDAYTDGKQPIVIAKKIHGILFPFFKTRGILGINLYKTIVSQSIFDVYQKFNSMPPDENPLLSSIKYHEPLTSTFENAPLESFFNSLLPKYFAEYNNTFLNSPTPLETNFRNQIEKLKNPLRKNLTLWMDWHDKVIETLKKIKYYEANF